MSGHRLTRSGLAILLPVALLLLLLGYEARTEHREVTRPVGPASKAGDAVHGKPNGAPASGATGEPAVAEESLAAAGPEATKDPDGEAPDGEAPDREGAATPEAADAARKAGSDPATPALSPVIILTVGADQTLATIADHYATTVETLQKLNGIIDPNYLPLGQELMVPDDYWGEALDTWPAADVNYSWVVIGTSTNTFPIESFVFGDGHVDVVVVGGIHGGYEWNSVLLAYRFLAYFSSHPEAVPENVRLHIIPTGNPDGIAAVTGQVGPFAAASVSGDTTTGRTNGNGVDLNRNWGCDWSTDAQWRDVPVSGGTEPFSEPETRALRDYLSQAGIEVVIWLHSAAGLVIPAGCEDVIHRPSEVAAALYGEAAGYPVGAFTAYPISGDAGNWLAQQDIASFTVELSDHQNVELDRNLQGLLTLLEGIEVLQPE